jgi:hypothetical protein
VRDLVLVDQDASRQYPWLDVVLPHQRAKLRSHERFALGSVRKTDPEHVRALSRFFMRLGNGNNR